MIRFTSRHSITVINELLLHCVKCNKKRQRRCASSSVVLGILLDAKLYWSASHGASILLHFNTLADCVGLSQYQELLGTVVGRMLCDRNSPTVRVLLCRYGKDHVGFLLVGDQASLDEDIWDDLPLTLRTTKWDEGTRSWGILRPQR